MLSEERIRAELNNVLDEVECPSLGKKISGKVRDSYRLGDKRVLVTTDRISAFDRILGTIPFKGQVLNQIAAFWFEKTKEIIPNHVISVPDPNIMVVAECEQLPLEFIMRGYLTGVTNTSIWTAYKKGIRNFCGNPLPDGMQWNQKLPQPILTPTTKHEVHDRNVSRQEAIEEGLISPEVFDEAAALCAKLFDEGIRFAATRGLILVDTKYEIGRLNGKLVVSDEIHTPDSSRYWFADTYSDCFLKGLDQRKLDKEYVREWMAKQGFTGDGVPPALTDEVRVEAAKRYIQAYETVTGKAFVPAEGNIKSRVQKALAAIG
ncbi:MAG: phosphoribosylaminoimidazolesuccinocarboxamide synthase [Kiritimatiellia bacterium]